MRVGRHLQRVVGAVLLDAGVSAHALTGRRRDGVGPVAGVDDLQVVRFTRLVVPAVGADVGVGAVVARVGGPGVRAAQGLRAGRWALTGTHHRPTRPRCGRGRSRLGRGRSRLGRGRRRNRRGRWYCRLVSAPTRCEGGSEHQPGNDQNPRPHDVSLSQQSARAAWKPRSHTRAFRGPMTVPRPSPEWNSLASVKKRNRAGFPAPVRWRAMWTPSDAASASMPSAFRPCADGRVTMCRVLVKLTAAPSVRTKKITGDDSNLPSGRRQRREPPEGGSRPSPLAAPRDHLSSLLGPEARRDWLAVQDLSIRGPQLA